jgi:EmrB/QacA subfamily drug resistance transporter
MMMRRFSDTRWWALTILSIAQLMVALDATVINIALPPAQRALHFSTANRQWLITAYALAFGSLMLLGGRLSDLFGRRVMLLIGLSGFAAASSVGGLAHSFMTLVAARAVQGVFGALLTPAALAAVTTLFEAPKERSKAFAIYGAIGSSGAAIGLLLGGALTQYATWRWCLFINVVFAGLSILGVLLFVEGGGQRRTVKLDVPGALLASAGLFFVVFGLGEVMASTWTAMFAWGSILLGALLLWAFIKSQTRASSPLLPLRILRNRTRAGSLFALFVTTFGMYGASLFLSYYMEDVLHYTPLRTGFAFLPLVVAIGVSVSVASARLLDLVGPRPLIPVGMVMSVMGLVLFTRLPARADYISHGLPGLVILGFGQGLIFAPAIASATAGITKQDAGAASATAHTVLQIGGSVGAALLNTIAVSATRVSSQTHVASVTSTLHGYTVGFWWAAGFFAVGAIVTFFVLPNGIPEFEPGLVPLL